MRDRTFVNGRNDATLVSEVNHWNSNGNNVYKDIRTVDVNTMYDVTWCRDLVVKDYKKRVEKGEIFNNPYHRIRTFYKTEPADIRYRTSYRSNPYNDIWTHYGFVDSQSFLGLASDRNSYISLPDVDITRLRELAVTDAWSRVSGSEAALLVSLGELGETLRGIADVVKRFANLAVYLRKMEIKKMAKALSPKQWSNYYMEWRYMWRPLIQEIQSYKNAFEVDQKFDRFTFRGHREDMRQNSDTLVVQKSDFDRHIRRTGYVNVVVRAGVLTQMELDLWALLGVLDFPSAVWDLVPLSFVWDWFFNIGKTISSLTVNPRINILASWVTISKSFVFKNTLTNCPWHPLANFDELVFTHNRPSNQLIVKDKERITEPPRSIIPKWDARWLDGFKTLDLGIILSQIIRTR